MAVWATFSRFGRHRSLCRAYTMVPTKVHVWDLGSCGLPVMLTVAQLPIRWAQIPILALVSYTSESLYNSTNILGPNIARKSATSTVPPNNVVSYVGSLTHMYVCIYVYVCMYADTYLSRYVYVYTNMMCTYVCIYIYIYIYVHMCMHIHLHILYTYMSSDHPGAFFYRHRYRESFLCELSGAVLWQARRRPPFPEVCNKTRSFQGVL